jgi:hypothetical protein
MADMGGTGGLTTTSTTGGFGGSANGTGGIAGMGGISDAGTDASSSCTKQVDCAVLDDDCHVGNCINGGCVKAPANEQGPCDDSQFCTVNDHCMQGTCVGGGMNTCSGGDACHIATCNEAMKICEITPGNDGMICDDGNPCTGPGACNNGTCSAGPPIDCSALNGPCKVGVCDPMTGCKEVPGNEGAACDDSQFCTINDHCAQGTCMGGGPKPCAAPPNICMVGVCDEATDSCIVSPGNDGTFCDDGNVCTSLEKCSGGICTGGTLANNGLGCDDGNPCTIGDICQNGICGSAGPTVYFSETFADNSKGWLLGPEWQIGPAMSSSGQTTGNPDPANDHTLTADNGVAGIVIGGNENPQVHPYYWLESPPFNAAVPGPVILTFYRWLNSDYAPYMHNAVEVWDGAMWVNIWTSMGPPPIFDSSWNLVQFDVTAYKGAGMRIRFGYDIGQASVYTVSSWNLDDVVVANAVCP